MVIRKLIFANFAIRKTRVALTVAAVALSVSLVVAVTSGYASLFEAAYQYLTRYMGTTDARISRANSPFGVPMQVVEELRKDPQVRRADGRVTLKLTLPDPRVKSAVAIVGIDRPDDKRVDRMVLESGQWFTTSTANETVIDQSLATTLNIKVGGTITFNSSVALKLKVVGIVHKPEALAATVQTVYIPLRTLQQFIHQEGRLSTILVDLSDKSNQKLFQKRWEAKLSAYGPDLKIHLVSETRSQLEKNLQGIKLLSYLGGAVSMLAATFIIFSALSMGVAERQRSLAMLRAVGAFKGQIGRLVICEGLMLALMGLAVGTPLGWFWIKLLTLLFKDVFSAGAVFSWDGLLFGATSTLLTALIASLLPAWTATRVSPLEAMAPLSQAPDHRAPFGWAAIGLVLMAIDPFLFFGPMESLAGAMNVADPVAAVKMWKFYAHFAAGLPGLFIGFFLLAPMCVWVIERTAGPLVAGMFRLRYALLRQQLSSGIWRSAGTGAALMVGLSVLIVMQVTGHTLLNGWRLPDKFPDIFIVNRAGFPAEQIEQVAHMPAMQETMRVGIGIPTIDEAEVSTAGFFDNITKKHIFYIGVDADKAFEMMQLEYRDGNAKDAQKKLQLKNERWVIVTEEYRQTNPDHSHIGDKIWIGNHEFRIAAVVWSPGIDVMVGMYDMGDMFEPIANSSVFGSIENGGDFIGHIYVVAANLKPGTNRPKLVKQLKEMGLESGDVREIKEKIQKGFYRLLYMLSTVAFAAMAVASLGVANTIIASVRSRRWQFGILRSIGVTRSQLLRLVLAEAVLLGLIGCVLGLGAGFEMSADANALAAVMTGYKPPIMIPWGIVGIGLVSVMTISLLASVGPAGSVARAEPLTLLQAGRAST